MRPRTDPEIIRNTLIYAHEHGVPAAARHTGINHKTIYRWIDNYAGQLPTDADVAAWRSDQAANSARRRRQAAMQRDYKKRRYLARGARMKIDSTGTVRRIRALYALGWTGPQLARELGVTAARVNHLASGHWREVHRHTAATVAALYDRLSMIRPVDSTSRGVGHIRIHERQRRMAAARDWAPPLAWDNIDDPAERPKFGANRGRQKTEIDDVIVQRLLDLKPVEHATVAEKNEAMRRWLAAGRPERQLLEAHGWKDGRYGRREAA